MNKYILDGHTPVIEPDIERWARWFENADRTIARKEIGSIRISTVFLGLDHSFDGPPLLFETMVFGGPRDQECARYTTWDKAVLGHQEMIARIQDELGFE